MSESDLKQLWQSQEQENAPMPIEQIHASATRFQRRVRLRNLIEYAAGLIVVPSFAWQAIHGPNPLYKIGAALIVLGALVCLWQLHLRGGARRTPGASAASLTDFHRCELVRQQKALKSVWLWYLGPFAPGMALCLTSFWLYPPARYALSPADGRASLMVATVVAVLVFMTVFGVNRLGARRLQREIDKLDDVSRS